MKKIIISLAILFAFAGQAQAQVFILDQENMRNYIDEFGMYPFVPGHDVDYDQGYAYVPTGSGAALLIGFGAAYLMAKKRKSKNVAKS